MRMTMHTDRTVRGGAHRAPAAHPRDGRPGREADRRRRARAHQRDAPLAEATIPKDHAVNRLDVEIDELCIRLLALRQPAARDLRFITTALKITTDLERIGDLAVNICERALELLDEPPLKPYIDLPRMAEIALAMLRRSARRVRARGRRARARGVPRATTRSTS